MGLGWRAGQRGQRELTLQPCLEPSWLPLPLPSPEPSILPLANPPVGPSPLSRALLAQASLGYTPALYYHLIARSPSSATSTCSS